MPEKKVMNDMISPARRLPVHTLAMLALLCALTANSKADDTPAAAEDRAPTPVQTEIAPADTTPAPPPVLRAELQDVSYVRALVPPVQLGTAWRTLYQLHHAATGGDLLILSKGSTRIAVYARRQAQLAGKAARFALTESLDLPDLPAKARFSRCSLPGSTVRDVIALSGMVGGKTTRVWGLGADAAGRLQVIPPDQLETLSCSPQGVNVR